MERVLDQTLPTFADFAEKHEYDVISCRTNVHADGRPASWGKVRLMRSLLERYDIVLWLDADAVVLDGSADPADLLGPADYQALVLLHQEGRTFPTCGVWLVRSTEKAKAFLDAIWSREDLVDHHWWEQAAVVQLLGYLTPPASSHQSTPWTDGTMLLDESWNRMPLYTRSLEPCRIRHYAGERDAVRIRQARSDRHELAAAGSPGLRRQWHRLISGSGRLWWHLVDGPFGTYGVKYRGQLRGYEAAKSVGLVTLVRTIKRIQGRRMRGR